MEVLTFELSFKGVETSFSITESMGKGTKRIHHLDFFVGERLSKKPCLYPTPDFPYLCAFVSPFLESSCFSYSRYLKRIYVLCDTVPTGLWGSHNFKRWLCFPDASMDTSWVWDINQLLPGSLVWSCHKARTVKSQNNTFQEEDYFSFKVCFWGGGECK